MDRHIETLERRCPRLGGSVISISYCLTSGNADLPCFKILDCWWETFDVETYLREQIPGPVYRRFIESIQAPPNKVSSIIEMANAARMKTETK
jgi:hypothetical protein